MTAVAAVLVTTGAFAADVPSTQESTLVKPDGSYTVTDSLPARGACPAFKPSVVAHYSSAGLAQVVTSDLFCGSYVEKVLAPDGSIRMSRRFEGQEDGPLPRLASVEFRNKGDDWKRVIVLLSPTREAEGITVYFGPELHDIVLICTKQPNDGSWHIEEVALASHARHEALTVPNLRYALPAGIPTSFAEVEHAWHVALTEVAQVSLPVGGM